MGRSFRDGFFAEIRCIPAKKRLDLFLLRVGIAVGNGIQTVKVAPAVHELVERAPLGDRDGTGPVLVEEAAYREALMQRQIASEGTFAAKKWGHNLTRVLRRGREVAEDGLKWVQAMNNIRSRVAEVIYNDLIYN